MYLDGLVQLRRVFFICSLISDVFMAVSGLFTLICVRLRNGLLDVAVAVDGIVIWLVDNMVCDEDRRGFDNDIFNVGCSTRPCGLVISLSDVSICSLW